MKDKKYFIAEGINFKLDPGSSVLKKTNDRDKYFYRDNLLGIFDNEEIKRIVSRSLGLDTKIFFSEKYREWLSSYDETMLDMLTPSQCLEAQLQFADSEDIEKINEGINLLKKKYEKFFKQIEHFYKRINNSQDEPNRPCIKDGQLVFDDGIYLIHNTKFTEVEDLESRHDLGLLASEWFGKLEWGGECRFCASFIKIKNIKPETISYISTKPAKYVKGLRLLPELTYVIDCSSPELQKLLHLDFYQFLRKEREGALGDYTSEELEFLRNLKSWNTDNESEKPELLKGLSGSASAVSQKRPSWCMIPGGVPSKYIVGIIARNINPNSAKQMEYIKAAGDIFGVPVVDEQLSVIYASQTAKLKKIKSC